MKCSGTLFSNLRGCALSRYYVLAALAAAGECGMETFVFQGAGFVSLAMSVLGDLIS